MLLFLSLLMIQVLKGQTKKRIIMPNLQKEIETKTQQEFLLWLNANKKIQKYF